MTDAQAGGEQAEVLLQPTTTSRQAGGEQAEVLLVPDQSLRNDQIGGLVVEVLMSRAPLPALGWGSAVTRGTPHIPGS